MMDPNREVAVKLASAICACLNRGEDAAALLDRLKRTLAPQFKLGNERDGRLFIDWAFGWVGMGMPHVLPNAKLAASFMATEVPAEFCDHVVPPWLSFMATVPADVFQAAECTIFVDMKRGASWRPVRMDHDEQAGKDDAGTDFARIIFSDRRPIGSHVNGVFWNVCERWRDFTGDLAPESAQMRTGDKTPLIARRGLQAIMRFAFGVCAEMSSRERPIAPTSMRDRENGGARVGDMPTVWTIRQTRPVRVDVRAYVSSYLSGQRSSLTTQHVVRGHWRNQPYGPQSSLRKFIHIEPHWKGPVDSPIAVRQHILSGQPADGGSP